MIYSMGTLIFALLQGVYPDRFGLGLSLLGVVLGPLMAWNGWQAIRNREGDYDSAAYASSQAGAWIAMLIGTGVTAGALVWLVRWLPEYVMW